MNKKDESKEYWYSRNRKQRTLDNIRELNERILYLFIQADSLHEKEDELNNTWWGIFEAQSKQMIEYVNSLRTTMYLRRDGN